LAAAKSCWAPERSWGRLLWGVGSTTLVLTGEVAVVELEPDFTVVVVVGAAVDVVVVVAVDEDLPLPVGVVWLEGGGAALEQ
jgi:hypothetical protein